MCAFSPISCSKYTLEIGRKLCAALSCSLRKYFSTAWRIVSDSPTASDSVSIRNQVLPPGASQTYLMPPPQDGSRPEPRAGIAQVGCDVESSKIRTPKPVNSYLGRRQAAQLTGSSAAARAVGARLSSRG